VAQPSIIRVVTIEPTGIDIDITLFTSTKRQLATSASVGGSEGFLVELDAGSYNIFFGFLDTVIEASKQKFCETFYVEIGVIPQASGRSFVDAYGLNTCTSSKEELDALFETVFDDLMKPDAELFEIKPTRSTYFTLPVNDLSESESVIYETEITIPFIAYGTFEIMS
jgi:hypothetical protein